VSKLHIYCVDELCIYCDKAAVCVCLVGNRAGPYRRHVPVGVKWDPNAAVPIVRDWEQVTRVVPLDGTYEDLQAYLLEVERPYHTWS
jgi:hypothetical protein